MYEYIHGIYQELLLFFCTFLFVLELYMVCTLSILVKKTSYLENANPFSERAKPFSGEYVLHTYSHEPRTYHASEQESAFLYIPGSYTYIHPKNGAGRWSAFLGHFCKNVPSSVCQRLSMDGPC
jgi:hypothetical protein